jgi:hypothetical protein
LFFPDVVIWLWFVFPLCTPIMPSTCLSHSMYITPCYMVFLSRQSACRRQQLPFHLFFFFLSPKSNTVPLGRDHLKRRVCCSGLWIIYDHSLDSWTASLRYFSSDIRWVLSTSLKSSLCNMPYLVLVVLCPSSSLWSSCQHAER